MTKMQDLLKEKPKDRIYFSPDYYNENSFKSCFNDENYKFPNMSRNHPLKILSC